MAVSYKKLWHILVDRDMKKKDLEALAGLSHYTMSKMSRDENVTTEVLGKVCAHLIAMQKILQIFFLMKKTESVLWDTNYFILKNSAIVRQNIDSYNK